jgi:hypothetical protein
MNRYKGQYRTKIADADNGAWRGVFRKIGSVADLFDIDVLIFPLSSGVYFAATSPG